jgi:parallel beta helix pectate lyase-like protein
VPSRRGHSRAGHLGTLRARIIATLQEFGPINGAAIVRAAASPSAISVPGGAVSFTSPSDLASKIAANPSGTHFVAANSMFWTQEIQTDHNKACDIWIPSGVIIDGNFAQTNGLVLKRNASLHGGEWKNFGSTGSETGSAVVAHGSDGTGSLTGNPGPVLVEDATFHHCWSRGFVTASSNSTIRRCLAYSNGRYGWTNNQAVVSQPPHVNVKIENVQWYDNNTRHLGTAGDAGGMKVTAAAAIQIRSCWAHDNYGSGIWTDYADGQHIIEENVVEGNRNWGIFYEVGDGNQVYTPPNLANAIIRHNFLKDNANAQAGGNWFDEVQLLASCTDGLAAGGVGFEVHNNYIDGFFKALGFVDHDSHPTDQRGMHCHDNDVWLRGSVSGNPGFVGGSKEGTFDPFTVAANNTFVRNRYHVTDASLVKWRWNNLGKTWAQWQALGNDVEGALLVDA